MRPDRVIKLPVFRTMIEPVARKAWKCHLCKEPMEIERRYVHYIDRRPHEIVSYRFHHECFEKVMAYCAINHRTSFTPVTVRNWVKKTFCGACADECQFRSCKRLESAIKIKLKELKKRT